MKEFSSGSRRVFEFLLADRAWHTAAEIEECCEVTAHSRLSDLRGAGHLIEKRLNAGATGRRKFSYRLVATADEMDGARGASLVDPGVVGADPGSTSDTAPCTAEDDFAAVPYHGDCGQAAASTEAAAEPAFDSAGIDEAAWRDRFGRDDLDEALPPRAAEQLDLLGVGV